MSARAWQRRRSLKYYRPYMKYVGRHPDRTVVVGALMMLNQSVSVLDIAEYRPTNATFRGHPVFTVVLKEST